MNRDGAKIVLKSIVEDIGFTQLIGLVREMASESGRDIIFKEGSDILQTTKRVVLSNGLKILTAVNKYRKK